MTKVSSEERLAELERMASGLCTWKFVIEAREATLGLISTIRQLRTENEGLRERVKELVNYRNRVGPLGFQLEKADHFIRELEKVLGEKP